MNQSPPNEDPLQDPALGGLPEEFADRLEPPKPTPFDNVNLEAWLISQGHTWKSIKQIPDRHKWRLIHMWQCGAIGPHAEDLRAHRIVSSVIMNAIMTYRANGGKDPKPFGDFQEWSYPESFR